MEFFLNVFSEFADFSEKIFDYSKRIRTPTNQPPLVLETSMLPQRQHNTCERQDI